jgi:hypothetical protein
MSPPRAVALLFHGDRDAMPGGIVLETGRTIHRDFAFLCGHGSVVQGHVPEGFDFFSECFEIPGIGFEGVNLRAGFGQDLGEFALVRPQVQANRCLLQPRANIFEFAHGFVGQRLLVQIGRDLLPVTANGRSYQGTFRRPR